MKKAELFGEAGAVAPLTAPGKWEQEFRAFLRLRPSLLRGHRNKYVAIHRGKVVDTGNDKVALGLRVYTKFGYVPIYVGQISSKATRKVRVPSPRLVPDAARK
jgi:hypothetical protein